MCQEVGGQSRRLLPGPPAETVWPGGLVAWRPGWHPEGELVSPRHAGELPRGDVVFREHDMSKNCRKSRKYAAWGGVPRMRLGPSAGARWYRAHQLEGSIYTTRLGRLWRAQERGG